MSMIYMVIAKSERNLSKWNSPPNSRAYWSDGISEGETSDGEYLPIELKRADRRIGNYHEMRTVGERKRRRVAYPRTKTPVPRRRGMASEAPRTPPCWPSLTANFLGSGGLNPGGGLNSGGCGGSGEDVEAAAAVVSGWALTATREAALARAVAAALGAATRHGRRRGARCSAAGGAMDCIGGARRRLARRRGSFCGACAARRKRLVVEPLPSWSEVELEHSSGRVGGPLDPSCDPRRGDEIGRAGADPIH